MELNKSELELIISALSFDTMGKWGDGRQERIDKLVAKLNKAQWLLIAYPARVGGGRLLNGNLKLDDRNNK